MAESNEELTRLVTDPAKLKEFFTRNGYYASVTFFNQLPQNWKVDITQEGCKFIDDDGHNDDKAAYVSIGPGENYTLNSTYNGCCRIYVVVAKAVRSTDGKEWPFFDQVTVDKDYCGGELKWRLVPKKAFVKYGALDQAPFEVIIER